MSALKDFLCSWFRHKLRTVQTFENGSWKQHCTRCDQYFVFNKEYEVFVGWTPLVEQFYVELTGSRTIL